MSRLFAGAMNTFTTSVWIHIMSGLIRCPAYLLCNEYIHTLRLNSYYINFYKVSCLSAGAMNTFTPSVLVHIYVFVRCPAYLLVQWIPSHPPSEFLLYQCLWGVLPICCCNKYIHNLRVNSYYVSFNKVSRLFAVQWIHSHPPSKFILYQFL